MPSRLFTRLFKLKKLEAEATIRGRDRSWNAKPGSSVHLLRQWLRNRFWDCLASTLEPKLKLQKHHFHQHWRLFNLRSLLRRRRHKNRTEASALRLAQEVDFQKLRTRLLDDSAAQRCSCMRNPGRILRRPRNPWQARFSWPSWHIPLLEAISAAGRALWHARHV